MRALRTVALAGAAAVALSGIAIGAASADPTVTPGSTDIVAVGSDTLTPLFDKWSADYVPTTGGHLYSWDATGSALITTKNATSSTNPCGNGTTTTTRPNGSGAGISALNANVAADGSGDFCVDIARSSRPITANDGAVSSIALSEDGIAPALNSTTHGVGGLTLAQLQAIFNCTDTTWTSVGGTSTDTIVPVLPQSSSGTRQTFLTDIGVATPGSCVVNANGAQAIEENEGNNNVFTTGVAPDGTTHNTADEIWPFSIGEYISQVDKGTQTDVHGNAVLQNLKNARGVSEAPVINPGTTTASINTAYPILRTLFAVVRGNSGTVPAYLQPLLGNNDATGWACSNATAQADNVSLGFLNIANCGALTHF